MIWDRLVILGVVNIDFYRMEVEDVDEILNNQPSQRVLQKFMERN